MNDLALATERRVDERLTLNDVLRLVRFPNLTIIFFTMYLARICLVGPKEQWLALAADPGFLLLCVSTLVMAAAGYIINDYYDIKIDTINKPERVIIGRKLSRRHAMAWHTGLNATGILLGAALSWKIAAVNFLLAFWLWLYSNQLKRMPFLGNLAVALLTSESIFVLSIYFGETIDAQQRFLIYTFTAFAFFISLIRELIKDMEDIRGDMHFACRTLPIVWGIRRTKYVVYFVTASFVASVVALNMAVGKPAMTYYFLLMLVPLGFFVYRLYWADRKREYRFLSGFCKLVMISGMLMMPLL